MLLPRDPWGCARQLALSGMELLLKCFDSDNGGEGDPAWSATVEREEDLIE